MFGFGLSFARACLRPGASAPVAPGNLQIDGFDVLVDTFPIVFS